MYLQSTYKIKDFSDNYLKDYTVGLNYSNQDNEDGFMKMVRNENLGITVFRGDYNNFNSWKDQTLNASGNIDPIPCVN